MMHLLQSSNRVALSFCNRQVYVAVAAALLHSAYLMTAVNELALREASRAYGRQLILSCESLMHSHKSSPPKDESA